MLSTAGVGIPTAEELQRAFKGLSRTVTKRIVGTARQTGKRNATRVLYQHELTTVDIETGQVEFEQAPEPSTTVELEVSDMTPASTGHATFNDDPGTKEDVDRRYAELMGHKKPKHLRTAADERALAEAKAKREAKARKRLQTQRPGETHG